MREDEPVAQAVQRVAVGAVLAHPDPVAVAAAADVEHAGGAGGAGPGEGQRHRENAQRLRRDVAGAAAGRPTEAETSRGARLRYGARVSERKASDVFVECLEAEGVQYVFGIPGEETLDLNESLADSTVQFVPVRHEQGGAYMADAYGRLTGRAGCAWAPSARAPRTW